MINNLFLYNTVSDGELCVAPDGKSLAIYNHMMYKGWFSHREAEAIIFKLDNQYRVKLLAPQGSNPPQPDMMLRTFGGCNNGTGSLSYTRGSELLNVAQDALYKTTANNSVYNVYSFSTLDNQSNVKLYNAHDYKPCLRTSSVGQLLHLMQDAALARYYEAQGLIGGDFKEVLTLTSGHYMQATGPRAAYHYSMPLQQVFTRHTGNKLYELADHLGNVRATVSDAQMATCTSGTWKTTASVNSHNYYYPFGMPMPGMYGPLNSTYRFGFNGKENDNEVKGFGNSLDFGARIYDPRVARWMSVDSKASKYPELSPFSAFGLNPILFIDPGGETLKVAGVRALTDIQSVVPSDYQSKITIKDDGEIVFDISKNEVDKINDVGVFAVYNLVNSSFNYSYQTFDKVQGINSNSGKIENYDVLGVLALNKQPTRWRQIPVKDSKNKIIYDKYIKKIKNGKIKYGFKPRTNYIPTISKPLDINIDNMRITNPDYIPPVGYRPGIVLHELLEMYFETDIGLPYAMYSRCVPPEKMQKRPGAHNSAMEVQSIISKDDVRHDENIKQKEDY